MNSILQDNRLEYLHPAFFSSLKSLTSLDLSNNKLQHLPYEMWTASKLKELNVAFNLLSELPLSEEVVKFQHQLSDQSDFDSDSMASTDNIFEVRRFLSGLVKIRVIILGYPPLSRKMKFQCIERNHLP